MHVLPLVIGLSMSSRHGIVDEPVLVVVSVFVQNSLYMSDVQLSEFGKVFCADAPTRSGAGG